MRYAVVTAGLSLCVLALGIRSLVPRFFIFNSTASEPIGVYLRLPGAPTRGDLVVGCLPVPLARFGRDAGYLGTGQCPADAPFVIKRVIAIAGDTITVSDRGAEFAGRRIPESARLPNTLAWRGRIGVGRYVVRGPELWLGSASRFGWDSRYFGPVVLSQLSRVTQLR